MSPECVYRIPVLPGTEYRTRHFAAPSVLPSDAGCSREQRVGWSRSFRIYTNIGCLGSGHLWGSIFKLGFRGAQQYFWQQNLIELVQRLRLDSVRNIWDQKNSHLFERCPASTTISKVFMSNAHCSMIVFILNPEFVIMTLNGSHSSGFTKLNSINFEKS